MKFAEEFAVKVKKSYNLKMAKLCLLFMALSKEPLHKVFWAKRFCEYFDEYSKFVKLPEGA